MTETISLIRALGKKLPKIKKEMQSYKYKKCREKEKKRKKIQGIPNRYDQKRKSLWHVITKTLSIHNKESKLKAKEKIIAVTYRGKHTRITAGFSMNTMEARRA